MSASGKFQIPELAGNSEEAYQERDKLVILTQKEKDCTFQITNGDQSSLT